MSDGATITTMTAETRPWVRGPRSWAPGDPPHFLGSDPWHPNELGVIWSDSRHTDPLAFEDWDGCRAEVYQIGAVAVLDEAVKG